MISERRVASRNGLIRDLAAAVLCAATVGFVARSDGGWWPTTWGWAALGLLFVATAALILQSSVPLGRLDWAFLGGLGAFLVWTGLSWLWSESPPKTMFELERTVLYVGGAIALLLVARRQSFAAALGGLLAVDVVICSHALATRLVPDRVRDPAPLSGSDLQASSDIRTRSGSPRLSAC